MRIDCLTIFPEMFESPLGGSIIRRARDRGIVDIVLTDIRDFSEGRHRKVDDRPYGGGPGMVMMPGPVLSAYRHVLGQCVEKPHVIMLSPQGRTFTQAAAADLAVEKRLVLISGRYEGFDERIRITLGAEQLSIGDYVLSGGELAAMVVIDAVVRLLDGSLGDTRSAGDDSFSNGLLEYPQYTRPDVFRGMKVPDVLLSGNHAEIQRWRREQSLSRTKAWRPDLLDGPG